MRHPDDGNLIALDAYLDRVDALDIKQQAIDRLTKDVLIYDWDDIIKEIGKELPDMLYRIYWGDMHEVSAQCKLLREAAERIAERTIESKW